MGDRIYPEREEHHYGSCKYHLFPHRVPQTYLAQMRRYRRRNSSTPVVEVSNNSNPPVQPVPHPGGRAPPTRFKVERSAYESKSSLQEFTVEAEYRKYASGDLSSNKTDILKFWEVRPMLLDGSTTHTLIGQ
jgi:hypothetical protein